jgi:hypothetical protein
MELTLLGQEEGEDAYGRMRADQFLIGEIGGNEKL